jgi:hypothetical protein
MAVIFIYLKGIQRSIVFKLNINNNNKSINLIIFSYKVFELLGLYPFYSY